MRKTSGQYLFQRLYVQCFFAGHEELKSAAVYHVGDGPAGDFRFGAFRATENDFSPSKMNRFPPEYAGITVFSFNF